MAQLSPAVRPQGAEVSDWDRDRKSVGGRARARWLRGDEPGKCNEPGQQQDDRDQNDSPSHSRAGFPTLLEEPLTYFDESFGLRATSAESDGSLMMSLTLTLSTSRLEPSPRSTVTFFEAACVNPPTAAMALVIVRSLVSLTCPAS